MTEQEVTDLFAAHDQAVLNGTANTKEWADRIKDAKAGIVGYTQQLKASQDALKTSVLNLGSSLANGETGASVFNDSIKSGADNLSTWLSSKGPVGAAIGTVVKATAVYVGAVNKQADALYKSYQDISRTGTIGHGGMRQVYTDMQKLGYGIKELDKFGSLISENSQTLAQFGGNATDGARAFANVGTELQHSDLTEKLLNMGVSVDEINQGAAGFIKQQVGLGLNQKNIGDQLADQTAKYIDELDTISRLTGQTRQQQEQKIADAQAEQAFNATMSSLKKKADAGDKDAQKQYDKFDKANRILEGDMRKNFIKGVGGDIAALGPLVNVAGSDLVDAINNPSKDINDVVGSLTRGFKQLNESGGEQLAQVNSFNNSFGDYATWQNLYSQYADKDVNSELAKVKANKTTTDAATKNRTATEIAQRKARDNLQDMVNFGIDPVTKIVEILSKVIEWITDFLPGAGKSKRDREMQKKVDSVPTRHRKVWKDGNLIDAEPAAGEATAETKKPAAGESTGKGLTGKDISGLDKGFATAIQRAADDYNSMTGKTVNVTSALRDTAKQQELYDAWISGKSKFPAGKPGTSRHERGLAIDVDLAAANEMDRLGLLGKYGLSRPVAGDPIHIQAKDGFDGVLSGPTSGYAPQITMHGTESLTIEPMSADAEMFGAQKNEEKTNILTAHLDTLDTLYRTIEKQNAVATKILQATT